MATAGKATSNGDAITLYKTKNTNNTHTNEYQKQKVDEGGKVSSIDDCENKKQGLNLQPDGDDKNCERLNGFLLVVS